MLKNSNDKNYRARFHPRIGIIGGGPAGLSLAYLLKEKGLNNTTVFEALPQVGGKSYTAKAGDTLVEMGTCYATFAHSVTNRWMKDLKLPMRHLGEQRFNGADFLDYFRAGSGPSLPLQLIRYRNAKRRLENALARRPIPNWALEEAAMPIVEWLKVRDLGKVENFMHRSTTNIAYGFVDKVSTLQALRWNDLSILLTGLFKQFKMPIEGWADFWQRLAENLDVKLATSVTAIERSNGRHRLSTSTGEQYDFDMLICAIPVDDFLNLTDATANESFVSQAIEWNGYTTSLFTADNWFNDVNVEAYKRSTLPGAKLGQLLSARYEGYEEQLGGNLYLSGQLSGSYTSDELKEMLEAGVTERGGTVTNIILQKMWKYHAQYKLDAIRDGLITRLEDMQGELNTWYTGATYSHEAVSHIAAFNVQLANKIYARSFVY